MPSERTPPAGCATRTVVRFEAGHLTQDDDRLAEEVPVAMHFDGEPFAVMMATPADLEDFARGFALTEGRVASPDDIASVEVREVLEGVMIDVRTHGDRPRRSMREDSREGDVSPNGAVTGKGGSRNERPLPRQLPGRSGCGICGSRELEDIVRHPDPVGAGPVIDATAVERALEALRGAQPINAFTGSVHAAGWAKPDGTLFAVREDVGRHNALDKLIGALLSAGIDTNAGFAVITSRASYEMVTKAAVAGVAVVVAISAPTALAVHLADDCGVTLVGFARPGRFNVYTRPDRISESAP